MKNVTRIVAAAGAIALVAGASTVTATAASATTPKTFGFMPISLQIPAMNGIWGGFQAVTGSKGYNSVIADPNFDGATANQQIQSWVTNKQVDGFWVITTTPTAISSAVQAASDAGIVSVVNGTPKDYNFSGMMKGVTFSSLPYGKVGSIIGNSLASCFAKKYKGSGQVIYVQGAAGSPGDPVILASAKKALKKMAPKVRIVATVAGNGDLATSQTAVASALQAHPKAVGVFGFSDEATMGAAAALKGAGVRASKTCITGEGGGDQAVAAVKAGSIYTIAKIDFASDLGQNIATLAKMAKNPAAKGTQIYTPIVTIKK